MRKTTAEQRHAAVKAQRAYDPAIREESYRVDLIRFQNHHNAHTDVKTIRAWALDYIKRKDKTLLPIVERASDYELRTIGLIARAISRDYYISLDHIVRVDDEIKAIVAKYQAKKQAPKPEPKKTEAPVEDRSAALARTHCAEIQGAIDDFVEGGVVFDVKAYLTANNVNSAVAKLIAAKFQKQEQELAELLRGKDEQLKEGYSFMGKVRQRKFHAMLQQIIQDCTQQVVTAKVRKPRAVKVKPPSVLVAKMKYQKEFQELNLKSESPVTIVGASTVWLYDTERRKVAVYVAESGQKLSVHGTTITGFSVKDSAVKTLRKPAEFMSGGFAKKTIMSNFNTLTTKPSAPNGRTNESTIILKVF